MVVNSRKLLFVACVSDRDKRPAFRGYVRTEKLRHSYNHAGGARYEAS